jgi:Protein of unknown function (DUF3048).
MKKNKYSKLILSALLILSFSGCGKKEADTTPEASTAIPTSTTDTSAAPAGTYFSETTGLPINEDIKNQKPIAVMIDCENIALPSFGVAEADIVYDMMNNVRNGRITRFMAIYKDYDKIAQIGSIRSTRTTNVWLAGEWNAILIHDGQASYALDYLYKDYAQQHLSSGFTRVDNGKASEFTEYPMAGEITSRIQDAGYNKNYDQFEQPGNHFTYIKYNTVLNTVSFNDATSVALPFPHNETTLAYNTETKTYDLSMYGELHKDADDDQVLTFTNALLLDCPFTEYPDGGYVYYNIVNNSGEGYYLTNGKMEPITWKKGEENEITHYYDANGKELEMNRGKTYISLVPSDVWGDLAIQ